MFNTNHLQDSCNSILKSVRNSCLNCSIQETPFSLYITIRKSESRKAAPFDELFAATANVKQETIANSSEKLLEEKILKVTNDYELAVIDSEEKYKENKDLKSALKTLDDKVSSRDAKLKEAEVHLSNAFKRDKALTQEAVNLQKEIQALDEKLKKSKSETDLKNKKIETLINEKNEIENNCKDMKAFAKETSTYYEQHTNDLQAKLKVFTEKQSKETSSQTDTNPDIPYKITSPLPPIFSSELCYKSPMIHLSRSLPSLDSICWCKPDEDFVNDAEEALCDQYDREVRDFYLDERERVRAAKEHAQLQKHHGHHLQPGDPTL